MVFLLGIFSGSVCFASVDKAWGELLRGDVSSAINTCQGCLESNDCFEKDKALFIIAEAYAKSGDFKRARSYYRTVYRKYPASSYASRAVLRIADSYFLEDNYEKAEKIYRYFVDNYPNSAFYPLGLLKLAYTERKLGKWDEVTDCADKLTRQFRGSFEAKQAKKLANAYRFFTVQVGAFVERKNALALVRKLQVDKFESYIVKDNSRGRVIYKVRVGKLKQRKEAVGLFNKLLSRNYPAQIYP